MQAASLLYNCRLCRSCAANGLGVVGVLNELLNVNTRRPCLIEGGWEERAS